MQLTLAAIGNQKATTLTVSEAAFGRAYNEALVHQVVTAYLAGGRAGTRAQKTRAEVSGGGAKPWKQKGTGRARAGSNRSPIWRTGGVTFASKTQDFSQKVNKKMYRGALQSILSELIRQERLIVVNELTLEQPKTKMLVAKLKELGLKDALIISENITDELYLASRNIPYVTVIDVSGVDPVSLISHSNVVVSVNALKKIEDMLA